MFINRLVIEHGERLLITCFRVQDQLFYVIHVAGPVALKQVISCRSPCSIVSSFVKLSIQYTKTSIFMKMLTLRIQMIRFTRCFTSWLTRFKWACHDIFLSQAVLNTIMWSTGQDFQLYTHTQSLDSFYKPYKYFNAILTVSNKF